jgi:hypothetical protein
MALVPEEIVHQHPPPKSITEIVREHTQVQVALTRGFYRAVLRHRAANVPMVVMRDGKMVHVDAHDIPIPDDILAYISTTPEPQFNKYTSPE